MTSEPSAEPITLTPGLSAYSTVGVRILNIEWMASGRLGAIHGLGSFEELLQAISTLYGRYGECMQDMYQLTIHCGPGLPLDSLPFNTLGMSIPPIESPKPENTSTSES